MGSGQDKLTDLSDEELIYKVRTEDSESYAEIVRRYQRGLYRFLRYLTNDPHAAEDLLQDVFIKTYRNLYGFDIKRKFSSWIYRIAHNEGINYVKKSSRRKSISWEDAGVPVMSNHDSPTDKLIKEEMQKRLRKYVSELKPKYREPLILHYFEDKSYQEISDILRIPIGTVGTLISRGKAVLKAVCEEKGGEPGDE
ncbi:MAG: RNA polymerase sigma factor [Candidatus Aerophobetes bacterium]|nr:RNA polymerase sigma factor [Candidatus Aerophobetes bacterium]